MIIKRIKTKNYKTYLSLDLDLSVKPDQPIILIGGMNGGGKTPASLAASWRKKSIGESLISPRMTTI